MTIVWMWSAFFALVVALLALDLFVFHRKPGEVSLRAAVGWTAFWIALGLLFSFVVYAVYEHRFQGFQIDRTGVDAGVSDGWLAVMRYLTAYVVEKSLSLDNIFVMVAVFRGFNVPARDQHRVLFWGILGAIVARAVLLATGVWLVRQFTWTFYIFGAILAVTGIRILVKKPDEEGPQEGRMVAFLRRHLPIAKGDHPGAFVTVENGKLVLTTLALALVVIEISDLIFAVDSVPAVLSVSTDTFILVTSNVFAILGLRSLYFVLAQMILRFRYLEPAMALLLVTIGAKMLLHDLVEVPNLVSLVAILGIVTAGILASIVANRSAQAD